MGGNGADVFEAVVASWAFCIYGALFGGDAVLVCASEAILAVCIIFANGAKEGDLLEPINNGCHFSSVDKVVWPGPVCE